MKEKLKESISEGQNFTYVRELFTIKNLRDISVASKVSNTALHAAAFRGHKEMCKLLISKSPHAINATDEDGWTALHAATFKGHKEVCELLISTNPEIINAIDKNGNMALHVAAFKGNKEVCKLLISKMNCETIDITNRSNWTALHLAAERSHKEICKVLIGNMRVKNSVKLLIQSSNDSPIQKAASEVVADFIKDKFLNSKINPMDFTGYQIKLLKLYQVVDREILASYFNEENGNSLCISSTDHYITKHYFRLIGVCKSVSEDSPISKLVISDCMPCMLSYLAPHSLCPELFAPTELLGEDEVISAVN